jgi:hypothetical protein
MTKSNTAIRSSAGPLTTQSRRYALTAWCSLLPAPAAFDAPQKPTLCFAVTSSAIVLIGGFGFAPAPASSLVRRPTTS